MAPSPAPYVSPVHREVQETGPPQSYALFLGTAERLHATREVPDQRDQHAPPVTNFIAPDKHFPCLIYSKNSNLDCLSVVRQYVDHVDLALKIASLRKSRNNRYVVNFEDHTSLIKLSEVVSSHAQLKELVDIKMLKRFKPQVKIFGVDPKVSTNPDDFRRIFQAQNPNIRCSDEELVVK